MQSEGDTFKQESIQVGWVPPACKLYVLRPPGVSNRRGSSHDACDVIYLSPFLSVNRQTPVKTLPVADLHSKILDAHPPPGGPSSFNFMQFWGNFGKIVCCPPPGDLAPPPRGNPGSATDYLPANSFAGGKYIWSLNLG